MLLICRNEETWTKLSTPERQEIYEQTRAVADKLTARGQYVAGHPLEMSSSATSVRVRDGKRLVTDGPFAETREQLGGYFLVDAPDRDAAVGIAARIPMARRGTIEVRPVVELPV